MPHLSIRGLDVIGLPDDAINDLRHILLPQAVAAIGELGIQPKDVDVYPLAETAKRDHVGNVFIIIDMLLFKPERTRLVLQRLTEVIAQTVQMFIEQHVGASYDFVEACIYAVMPDDTIYTLLTPTTRV